MPTSSPSNVTTKENPPNSSATPTAKSTPKVSAATAKEKEKDKPTAAGSGKGSMGARLSTTSGSAGKAPSTASASSTHTASTMPADGAEAKAKSKSGGGVASFLRRKPSSKESAAGTSAGNAAVKKDAKKGVGSSLRTSLFKRSTKSKNGAESPAATAGSSAPAAAGAGGSSGTSIAANSAGAKASPGTTAAAKPPTGASTSSEKGRASPEKGRTSPDKGRVSPVKGRTSPDKGRASPEKRRASTEKSPAEGHGGASPPKSQRPSSRTEASSVDSTKKSPSPRPGGGTAASRSNQGLTPERKEALKKQWFTDGKPLPDSAGRGRATGKTGAGSRTEPRSRPGAGETVGPPSSASRVSGSAFSAAAAKFGGVKAPPKPQPGSPKKPDKSPTSPKRTTGAPGSPKKAGGVSGNPKKAVVGLGGPKKSDRSPVSPKKAGESAKPAVTAEGLDDLMGAMSGFKTEEVSESKDANTKVDENTKLDAKTSAKDEEVSSSVSTDVGAKSDANAPSPSGGLDDLMGAMEGFSPGGSKTDKMQAEKPNNGMGVQEYQNPGAKEGKDVAKSEVSAKDDSKTADESGGAKDDASVPTNDNKESSIGVAKKDEKDTKGSKNDADSKANAKDASKDDSVTPKDKDDANDDKTKAPSGAAEESKAEKSSTWRHGDTDSGELGLGGISQKDREERAHRPSAPKDEAVDLDFLMGQIDTTPKPPAAEPKSAKKDDSPKAQKKPADKDAGLGDLMDLAKGFDMSAMSKSESVAAEARTAPEMAPSDMDKFLDMMDTTPAKPTAPPSGPPVKEEDAVKKDTWRLGDGDDEAMIALMNKPRDKDAPRQAPDWDIDDLLVGEVTKKPEPKEEKPASGKKVSGGQADMGGLSGFDDFIGGSLSSDAGKAKDKKSSEDTKPKISADGGDKKTGETGDKAFSGFDGFLSESLSGKDSVAGGDSKKPTDNTTEKESTDKKPSGGEFSGFDDFLSGSLAAEGDSNKPSDTTTDKKPADKKPAGGEFSAFDDFLSSPPTGKESTGGPPHEELVAAPKKITAVDSAPPAAVEEEVIAAASSSQTTAAPAKSKRALDKHISKEGDTRGSVPDHGHGVRDLLYDDSDKTGTKPAAKREDSKSREPAVLDDLIRPAKASKTSSAPPAAGKDDVVVAQAASTTEAGKPSGKKATDEHREKPGNTRGSVPDHGHGVRDVLYDDSDKTGQKKAGAKEDAKRREPAPLEDLIQPKKVAASHAAPGGGQTPSSGEDEEEEEESISAETAHQSQASGQPAGKKKRRPRKKKHAKEGDTRGSVPDHGHGARDVLYDDSDKTGRKKTPSESKGDAKNREPADLTDFIQPKKAAASHAAPAARSSSPESKQTDELLTAQTAHQAHAAAPASGKKPNKKKQSKEGDTRGSVPDHGHGARDVLYDDKDKTGRRKSGSKEDAKSREPAPLDDLIQPKKAAVSHAAPGKTPSRSPSPDDEEEDEISAETAHQSQAAGQTPGKKKRRSRKKKHAKEGDTRGSVPDHGHGVRDVLYDDSDKTGQKKSGAKEDAKRREPAPLEDLIQPKQATHTASAPPSHTGGAAAGAEQPLVAEKTTAVHSAPPTAAPPSPTRQEPARQSLSLAGMTDPDQEDSDDGEELRRLIASTEALQDQLHSARHGDSKQAHAVQEQTSQELERLERSLEQREHRLETAGRGQEVRAAKEGLQKVKQQLDASRAAAH